MLPDWLRDNFFIGFLSGCVFMCLVIGLDTLWRTVIKPRRDERRKRRALNKHMTERSELLEEGKRTQARERRSHRAESPSDEDDATPPSSSPRDALPEPHPDATAAIEAQPGPGRETMAMPAVRPSQFRTPPPPLPPPPPAPPVKTSHTHTPVPTDWDGEERRHHDEPFEGAERRGRHSDPEDRRRRRRDDAWDAYPE